MHHLLGLYGSAIGGIYLGRIVSVLSFLMIGTEFSTIFVALRWVLHFHKKTDGALYLSCAVMMTLSFFVVRVVFMSYILFGLLFPSFSKFNDSKDPEIVRILTYISITLYMVLFALNLFWFKKMVDGIQKHLSKSATSDNASDNASEQQRC